MSTARLLIAAAVLAGLGGVVWWSNKQEAAKADLPDANAPPKILALNEADISKIDIQHRGEDTDTVVTRNADGKWEITQPQALTADQGAVATVTSAASNLASERVVDENLTDPAAYGLDSPELAVTFTLKDGTTKHLRIGTETADGTALYASVDGDKRLFTMGTGNKVSFDKHAMDLREKHLLVFDSDKLSSLALNVPGRPAIEFGRTGDSSWQIVKPRPMRADGFAVDELVRTIHDAEMDTATAPKDATAKFASGHSVATARLTLPDSSMTFEVRENGGEFYAKSSALDGAYKVSLDTGKGVSKSLEDFRNKKLFDFGFDDPNKIEITDMGSTRSIEKSGEDWMSGGKKMDSLSVQNLVDKLRDLSASGFDNATFRTAELKLVVVSKNGSRTETVEISPAQTGFVARRTDGNTLYRLDEAAVTGLREAVNGVREPAPPDEKDAKSGKTK